MSWSTIEEEDAIIASVESSPRVEVDVIGQSVQGRPIRLLRCGTPPRPVDIRAGVLVLGANHASELAGREAILQWAVDLTETEDDDILSLMDQWPILLIPTMNPDGVANGTRFNAANVNLNVDTVSTTQPETRAVATVMGQSRPLAVIDTHDSLSEVFSVQPLGPTHPQVHSLVTDHGEAIKDAIRSRADTQGWANQDFDGSTSHRLMRNSTGLRHSAGVLVESARADTDALRQEVQYASIEEAFLYVLANAGSMVDDFAQAAQEKASEGASGTEDFVLSPGGTLSPPPLGYRLTDTQVGLSEFHREAFNIDISDSVVSMGQLAQPVVPMVFDPDSGSVVVAAERLFQLPGPAQPLLPRSRGEIRSRVRWYGCDLVTGQVIAPLHDLSGPASRELGEATTTGLTLPIPRSGPGRARMPLIGQATQPRRALIVLEVNRVPAWGGIVVGRAGGTGATLDLSCVSVEGYLDHRYVGSHTFVNADEAAIVRAVMEEANHEGIGFVVDAPDTGRSLSRTYLDQFDKTVLDVLKELMQDDGGAEFTVDLEWEDDSRRRVVKVFRLRRRIGRSASSPTAVFRTTSRSAFSSRGSSEARYVLDEDHSGGNGANHVVATSSGQGEDRPQSDPARAVDRLADGEPRWESRVSPSESILDTTDLDSYARSELRRVLNGTNTWGIQARWNTYPRLGVDWRIGDDIAWRVVGHRHPEGARGQGRCIGWELDPSTGFVRPILLDPSSDLEEA